jgi:L-alanine-DL-glutamate epimerase-like enolase superfamily enzyme
VATYASGALMRGLPLEIAAASARRLVERGFRAMKMQLALPGETSVTREVERARTIRDCIGPDIELMCDINQRWRVDQAIAIGRRLEPFGFAWLEDVAAHDDYPGLARVAAALSIPITGGEYVYGITPFRHMLEARAVDIVMIDPFRVGGITQWLKVAAMAEAFDLPVVSHLAPELQVHLVGAVPNGLIVEYMPWSVRLFEDVPRPDAGRLHMPVAPGLGLTLDRAAIRGFAAAP